MSVLVITHSDAESFLQRQASNDLKSLVLGQGIYVAFLNPQAKIIDLSYIVKFDQNSFYIKSNKPEILQAHLNRFIITEDVEIELADNELAEFNNINLEIFTEGDTLIKLDDQYHGKLLPKYVSFTKGCFPGQEPLAKFKNIGKPKREERSSSYLDEALLIFAQAPSNDSPQLDQAIDLLRKALKEDPSNEDAYETLGVILGRQGKYQEAIKVMQQLEMINAENHMALMNLSIFYMKIGDKEKAEEYKAKGTIIQFDQALRP